jgi:hypothetical protein
MGARLNGLKSVNGAIAGLLDDAIRAVVAEAITDGGIIRAGPEAERLARAYPSSGSTPNEIADAIILAAASAGVAAEISRPR